MRFDRARQVYLVEDSERRAAASLPVGLGGEVRTRTDHWMVQTERRKIGWAIVAHSLTDQAEVGSVREGLMPDTDKIHIGQDFEFHVTVNPIVTHWTLGKGTSHLARFSNMTAFGTAVRRGQSKEGLAGTITTLEAPPTSVPLALAIVLTLEMIKADASVLMVGSEAGMIF